MVESPGDSSPYVTPSPKDLIEASLAEIASRVKLVGSRSPASHTVISASGLDDSVVADSLGRYAVAVLTGWVRRDATIGDRLGVHGIDRRAEVRRLVDRIIDPPPDRTPEQLDNWRQTWRDAWIAEVLTHALLVIRRTTSSDCLEGPVVALLRPHPLPKRQGLDTVALYDESSSAVLVVGETKASCERGSDELTRACDLFDAVDAGSFGPDLRDAIDSLADVLPPELASQVSDSLWRDQRCYVPAVLHETPFDASLPRDRLAALQPIARRKRVLVLQLNDFNGFFDRVAAAMREAVDELVV
jgi:hypothetical protein